MLKRSTALLLSALLITPCALAQTEPGLLVRFFDLDGHTYQMPELAQGQLPNTVKIMPTLDLQTEHGDFKPFEDNFYVEVEGFLTVEKPGEYGFRLMSDDGSILWIDDQLVIDNDGPHSGEPKDGTVELAAGQHKLSVKYFEGGGDQKLELQWKPATAGDFTSIPPAAFAHDKAASQKTAPGKKLMITPLRRGLPGDGTPVVGLNPAYSVTSFDAGEQLEQEWLSKGKLLPMWNQTPQAEFGRPVAWLPLDIQGENNRFCTLFAHGYFENQLRVYPRIGEGKRVFIEKADGIDQGCVFRFGESNQRMKPTGKTTLEMLTVRALSNGFEIEFTKPIDKRCGWEPETYYVEQWPFDVEKQQAPRRDGVEYPVKSASVSPDRKKIFLEIENLKPSHVVYLRLLPPCYSQDGDRLWSTEAWYTLNAIPTDRKGEVLTPPAPEPQNFLTAQEKADGWKLLFDGKTSEGWHGYRKDSFPDGWHVKDGCLVRCGSAGDISTDGEWANFELKIEWRVTSGANSGIFYRVNEEFDWPFFSGPEYQVLDNAEHPDGKNPKTSAASNYALVAPPRDLTAPVGYFNQARIVVNGPHVEHWLNGEKVVEYELWTDEWKAMVAGSKFNAWKNYGLMKKGHIVLQDHGDMVWFRNIKIRELPETK